MTTDDGDGDAKPATSRGLAGRRIVPILVSLASAAAGLTLFVAVLGGVVLGLRLRKADVPTDTVLSLVPRELLIVLGMKQIVVPASTVGLFFLLSTRVRQRGKTLLLRIPLFLFQYVLALVILLTTVPVSDKSRPSELVVGASGLLCLLVIDATLTLRGVPRAAEGGRSQKATVMVPVLSVLVVSAVVVSHEAKRPAPLLDRAIVVTANGQRLGGAYLHATSDTVYWAPREGFP